nr:hypothetical protein [Tanacetum cinerariifolium]
KIKDTTCCTYSGIEKVWMMSNSLKALAACSSIIEVEEIEEEGYARCMAWNKFSFYSQF